MQLIKVGAAVLNQTPLAWDSNRANILAAIGEARIQGVSILCLPELCISGYGCEDAFHSVGLQRMAWRVLREIVPATRGMIVTLGLPLLYNNALYNTACLVADGRPLGFVAKRFLAGDGLHYEPRWFKGWPKDRQAVVTLDDESYPIGDIHFHCGGVRIGFEICEDAWVANRPGTELALRGADVILNPSASHFAFGKSEVRRRFVLEGSRAFGVSYVYANMLGNEAGRAIYDGGALVASAGKLLATGPRFSFADYRLTTAVIDVDATRMNQSRTASFQPQFDDQTSDCIRAPFVFPTIAPARSEPAEAPWETSRHKKEEEFTRAIALGLYDYLRKSRSRGFVVSLSGGADSSAVACLVALSVELGMGEIGREAFLGKLRMHDAPAGPAAPGEVVRAAQPGGPSEIVRPAAPDGPSEIVRPAAPDGPSAIVRSLLTCVYQSTSNSSRTTRDAARGLADAVGANFLELDVDPQVKGYVAMISKAIGRELTWQADDVALQNIQARARAPGVWLLANLSNSLLLATSNRSEAAVGYATMDGDTSGGLSPIAGIDKAFLRQWLYWRQTTGPCGSQPLPALDAVTRQTPTAELRPPEAFQTDEADLMPYEFLDAVERAAIRDKQTPLEIYQVMRPLFAQHSPTQIAAWIKRFFALWCRNQWKRERYAPSFHVDDENLDPKTWCRFPILSGGFERELAELNEFIAKEPQGGKPARSASERNPPGH